MTAHLRREIEHLKRQVLALGTLVEENLRRACEAIVARNPSRAALVAEQDTPIDLREVDVEEECLKVLALYQPVAADLRFIIAVLKLNNDLERIGDKSVKLAQRAGDLAGLPAGEPGLDFKAMAEQGQRMLKLSLDALVNVNVPLARTVCDMDESMDRLHRSNMEDIRRGLQSAPQALDAWLAALAVTRAFERIADHCNNIAEDVIYLADGEIVRHEASRRAAESRMPGEEKK